VLLALPACSDVGGGNGGDPVKPAVVPPDLGQVQLERDRVERSEVVRVALKEPLALPPTQIDQFKQSQGIVDILWVIDNSGSMADERVQLANNFSSFFSQLEASNVDFRIGVISTDGDAGGLLHGAVIDRSTPDANATFLNNVTFPPGRVRWVQGLAMMKQALTGANAGTPFIRPNAALAVIALSDGDDQSFGPVGYYARFLRGVKGQGNENWVTFSTISGDLPTGCQAQRDAQFYGSRADPSIRFTDMAKRTGGVVGSICDASFENSLSRIAQALNTLRKLFPLSLKPDSSTIQVTVNGVSVPQDPSGGWTYVAALNAIEFLGAYVPPPGSEIHIKYAIAQ
jgi:hypothetical protein